MGVTEIIHLTYVPVSGMEKASGNISFGHYNVDSADGELMLMIQS